MKKLKNNSIIEIGLTTILLGLMIYASYSLWYIFYGTESGGDVHLYTILSGMAVGWFLIMFIKSVFKNGSSITTHFQL